MARAWCRSLRPTPAPTWARDVSGIVRAVDLAAVESRLRAYVDDAIASLRRAMREEQESAIAAVVGWVRGLESDRDHVRSEASRRRVGMPEIPVDAGDLLQRMVNAQEIEVQRIWTWIGEHRRAHDGQT